MSTTITGTDHVATTTMELSDTSLSQDCLGCIEISGLAKMNDGEFVALKVPREVPDALSVDLNYCDKHGFPIGKPPSRDRNMMPWSGSDTTLKLKIGELIGQGSSGWVYAVEVISPSEYTFAIPPLVVKIAKQTGSRRLSEEAEAYDQLRSVQGTAVACCYGYFRRPVNLQELSIVPWDPECTFPRSKETFDVHDMPHPCASLSILLMERLGQSLAETVESSRLDSLRNIPPETLHEQLLEMCQAVSPSCLLHSDLRPDNILRASFTPPCAPCSSSTGTFKSANPWRLVDWEGAQKLRPDDESLVSGEYRLNIDTMMECECPVFYTADDELKEQEERSARKRV